MAIHAAQVDRMDQGIGRVIATLAEEGMLNETLVLFMADKKLVGDYPVGGNPEYGILHLMGRDKKTAKYEIFHGNPQEVEKLDGAAPSETKKR